MNNIKNSFSIKDLENLSGIKAHTIRIWEKRYGLLTPERTNTNIRTYSLANLQKLLNVTLLYKTGHKISKIAEIPEEKIPVLVKEFISENSVKNHSINAFKLSMINFDQTLFHNTYNSLLTTKSFREVFYEIFIPLLNELGLLWLTDTITPAHEHFVTSLIKQKILINTEKLQMVEPSNKSKTFVLYLPEEEIHEIGLLYVNFEVMLHGYHSIYLGPTVPLDSLIDLTKYYDNLYFISYFTVTPTKDKIAQYIDDFNKLMPGKSKCKLWALGHQAQYLDKETLPSNVSLFGSMQELVKEL